MKKKRAYRAVQVQSVKVELVKEKLGRFGGTVGIDVGKASLLVCLRYGEGTFERPWKVKNTWEVHDLIGILEELDACHPLPIGMESTGTYGDALRQALTDHGLAVHRVSGKACSDYAEVFDGVPSQHDGKDAAVIAELVAFGKSSAWPWRAPSACDQEMESWVDWLDIQQYEEQQWLGRLEALLSRYWPEATCVLSLRTMTLMRVLVEYGGPDALAGDKQAACRLRRWGGPYLSEEKIEQLISWARFSVGVRMTDAARRQIQKYAQEVLKCREERKKAEQSLARLASGNPVIQSQAQAVGLTTACVAWVILGDARDYASGAAYRKAMGLNLKERSSGKYQGQLKITKRGSALIRRWLYFAALRECQKPGVNDWYEAKKKKENGKSGKALIAIMRKLALAMHQTGAGGVTYDVAKLFPGEPLKRVTRTCASQLP